MRRLPLLIACTVCVFTIYTSLTEASMIACVGMYNPQPTGEETPVGPEMQMQFLVQMSYLGAIEPLQLRAFALARQVLRGEHLQDIEIFFVQDQLDPRIFMERGFLVIRGPLPTLERFAQALSQYRSTEFHIVRTIIN